MGGRGGFGGFKSSGGTKRQDATQRERKNRTFEERSGLKNFSTYTPEDIKSWDIDARVWSEDLKLWIDVGTLTLDDDTVTEDVFKISDDQGENETRSGSPPSITYLLYSRFNPEEIDRYEIRYTGLIPGLEGLFTVGTLWLKNGKRYDNVIKPA